MRGHPRDGKTGDSGAEPLCQLQVLPERKINFCYVLWGLSPIIHLYILTYYSLTNIGEENLDQIHDKYV